MGMCSVLTLRNVTVDSGSGKDFLDRWQSYLKVHQYESLAEKANFKVGCALMSKEDVFRCR